jgi:hypothetical protein
MRLHPLLLAVLIFPGCCFCNAGCSSGRGNVQFTSVAPTGPRNYLQDFPAAFISSNKAGEYDVVLLNDDLHGKRPRASKKPLQPIGATPLTQALKIHIFWRPVSGVMLHESSVTNAIIDWYVFGSRDGRHVDLLHYQGAGFVVINPRGNSASVTINDGQVIPTQSIGNIKDPVGKSTINGMIYAIRNDQRVKEILSTLADETAAAENGGMMPAAAVEP